MKARRHAGIILRLLAIGAVCAAAGAAAGYRLGRQEMRQRADPGTWHERASRRFDEVVHPSPEQAVRLGRALDEALVELKGIRQDAIVRSAAVIDRLVVRVEAELTPEQKAAFDRIKPRRDELMLDVLKVDRAEMPRGTNR